MGNEYNFVELLNSFEVALEPQREIGTVANIVDLLITTDSVVATAIVTTDNNMRRIVIEWGDGESDTLTSTPGVPAPTAPGDDDPLPPGIYRFSHAYDVSEDRRPFEHIVVVRVDDRDSSFDFRVRQITLTPRYRVTNYQTTVNLESTCDPSYEPSNEFDIFQLVDGQIVNQWRWEPSNSFFGISQSYRLEGSNITRELTVEDGAVGVFLQLIEQDISLPLLGAFHDYVQLYQNINATDESERIDRIVEGDGCRVRVRYDKEVQLIVPLPSAGGLHTFQASL